MLTASPLLAVAGSVSQSLTMNAGSLSLTDPGAITFTAQTIGVANGSISSTPSIAASDTRGSLAGWTITAASTSFVRTGTAVDVSGTTPTARMGFSGTYDCTVGPAASSGAGRYRTEITTGGAVGTAVFKWLNAFTTETTDVTTAATVSLDSGISATFTGTQVLGDVVALPVGCAVPKIQQSITPASLSSVSGSTSGISLGAVADLSATRTIFTAEAGSGNGDYDFNLAIALTILKNSLAGEHTATLTLTQA